jgi:4-hydroxybenzoate polyprenyltransferase
MISRLRLLVLLVRPAVFALLAMFTATGLAQAGRGDDPVLLIRALLAVTGFLLFSVACNDLADEAIDRINLPGQRPLVTGALTRREFTVIGVSAGAAALTAAATLNWPALVVTAAGLAISAGYSLRPVRLAERGAVASLILPACYVVVPYLTGLLAVRAAARPADLFLLAGLYLGFIGRILLKDFRDVRGDALFGKRTFLVRHGRGWTCAFSACCWLAGTGVILAAVHQQVPVLAAAESGCLAAALALLRALSGSRNARRDEAIVSALAIIGRGMVLLLLAHLSMISAGWRPLSYDLVMAMLCLLISGPTASMLAYGPVSRSRMPSAVGDGAAVAGHARGGDVAVGTRHG